MDCLFCKIVNKEIPAEIIYEDDQMLVFKDINPMAPVHVLLIPKKHIATLSDLKPEDQALLGHIMLKAQQMAGELGLEEQGFRLVGNCKEDGGQTVYHIHFHLLGGRPLGWPPG